MQRPLLNAATELEKSLLLTRNLEVQVTEVERQRRELEEAQRRAEEARRMAEEAAYLEKTEREMKVSGFFCFKNRTVRITVTLRMFTYSCKKLDREVARLEEGIWHKLLQLLGNISCTILIINK